MNVVSGEMAAAATGQKNLSLEGADKAIDSVTNLFVTAWEKSPTLVWFCAIMVFVTVLYHIHCRSTRKAEKEIDAEVTGKRRRNVKGKKALHGGKKNA